MKLLFFIYGYIIINYLAAMTYNQVHYFQINHLASEFWGIFKYHMYFLKYSITGCTELQATDLGWLK